MPAPDRFLARAGRLLARRLDELGRVSDDEPGKLTRTFLSPAMRRANALVAGWMREAGLAIREDSVGNLIGRAECAAPPAGERPFTLLFGSHLDTVRDAGRFDGALGVLLPIAALEVLRQRGVILPFSVEVLGFSEEEGVRFACAYLGSEGYVGRLPAASLKLRDAEGVTLREALEQFGGGGKFKLPRPAHARDELGGYVEVHIEQGPVLETRRRAVGIVTAIVGQTRVQLSFTGRAGHAGTTPMNVRRDALAGAAEFIIAVEAYAREVGGLVATVGRIDVSPGAPNVVPGRAVLALDVRHADDPVRRIAVAGLRRSAARIATRRKLTLAWEETQSHEAVACGQTTSALLEQSVRVVQGDCPRLVSGAGHDAVVLSRITDVAMLFVRCRDGLSHHPDEFASPEDITVALRVVVDFLGRIAVTQASTDTAELRRK